jgi:hypothetical protein
LILFFSKGWANSGEDGRELDYQIWCGPAMGAFNDWARNTPFEKLENRKVVDIALAIMQGVASIQRKFLLDNLLYSNNQ